MAAAGGLAGAALLGCVPGKPPPIPPRLPVVYSQAVLTPECVIRVGTLVGWRYSFVATAPGIWTYRVYFAPYWSNGSWTWPAQKGDRLTVEVPAGKPVQVWWTPDAGKPLRAMSAVQATAPTRTC